MDSTKKKLLFIVPVWGEAYSQLFIEICLPLILTSGNLGHFKGRTDVAFLIATRFEDQKRIENSPSYRRLAELIPSHFLLIDGVANFVSPHQAMSDAYVLAMRSEYVTPAYTNYVFLTPDSFWSDGTFRRVEELVDAGYYAGMVLGLRSTIEKVEARLRAWINEKADDPVIPVRKLVTLVLSALHPMAQAQIWLSARFLNQWPSQIYWRAGNNLMFAHCFHLHPLFMRATERVNTFKTTIDGDFLQSVGYPVSRYYVVTDSDEIFGVEMSAYDRDWGVPRGRPHIWNVVSFAYFNANKYHWHFFPQRIVFRGEQAPTIPSEILQNMAYVVREVSKHAPLAALARLARVPGLMRSAGRVRRSVRGPLQRVLRLVVGNRNATSGR
jgi:hypothetical protein